MRNAIRICFFLSGASGLVFELLWTRMLSLVFGSTTLAISTVLTAFMGGLGLGSWLAGRYADKLRAPARAYALAEAGIGLWALLVPWVISHYTPLNQWLWTTFGDHYGVLSLLRFAASALLLLVPTTLMGATLPILARVLIDRPGAMSKIGGNLGGLYALNLFGALAGSFMAGFVLMPTVGLANTNRVAATVNILLALVILFLHRAFAGRSAGRLDLDDLIATAKDLPSEAPTAAGASRVARKVVIIGFAISGAAAMVVQVLWTRALAVLIGSSIYSFTLILLAFLVGLGGGSALLGRWGDRVAQPVRTLAWVHLATVGAFGASYLTMDKMPFVFAWLLASTSFGPEAVQVCQFALACLVILPATLLMGAVFPLTMRVATASLDNIGHDVGNTYAVNTLGAIAGSFASGFVVLPVLGLQKGLYLAAVMLALLVVALFAVAPQTSRRTRALGIGLAAFAIVAGPLLPRWNLTSFSQGFFRVSIAKDYVNRVETKKEWRRPELVFYEDGVATTVTVEKWGTTYSMKNNGKVDASSDADMPTQVSVGLLPVLLHQGAEPPRVALIGFGSGVTAGSITQAPIKSLEVVELEPAIYSASRFFEHVNRKPLENPLVTAREGDGRNFLSQRTDKFDVIISQPSNPWITGVSNLFTREYFKAVKQRLAPGGIFGQWAQLYEMAPWNVKAIYKTLASEFPHVTVFSAEDLSSDTILIASMQPLPLDAATLRRKFEHQRTREEAARAGWKSPYDVFGQVLLTADEVAPFSAGASINTDDNALIEFAAPRDLLGYSSYDPYLARVYGAAWPYGHLEGAVTGVEGDADGATAGAARLARALLANGRIREAEYWTRKAEALGGSEDAHASAARRLMTLIATRFDSDPEIPLAPTETLEPPRLPPSAKPADVERVAREYKEVQALVAKRMYVTAYKAMDKWPAALWKDPNPDFALLAAFLHYKAEFYEDAVGLLKLLLKDETYIHRRPEVLYYLGRARFARGDHSHAVEALERFVGLQTAVGREVLPLRAPAGSALPLGTANGSPQPQPGP